MLFNQPNFSDFKESEVMSNNKVSGIIKRTGKYTYFLREAKSNYRMTGRDIFVSPDTVKKYNLLQGAHVEGVFDRNKRGKYLAEVNSVQGMSVDEFSRRTHLDKLMPINPQKRFDLSAVNDDTLRIIDLVSPVGKGTRGLIVSPPKAGKTTILEKIAKAITEMEKDTRVIVLLVDERPEEVTTFRRTVDGAEVIASTSDQSNQDHIELVNLIMSNVRLDLECGRDVVVLVDSLTRIGRAFNHQKRPEGRRGHTMSGGLEAGSMEIPRRFFGLARNIENGGSVTIIATALIDTGSRMDQLIFEEFKGTGNSELVLDRNLANQRIYPAIDIPASGTRKEYNFYSDEDMEAVNTMRRVLTNYNPSEAIEALRKMMNRFPTNREFLESLSNGQVK